MWEFSFPLNWYKYIHPINYAYGSLLGPLLIYQLNLPKQMKWESISTGLFQFRQRQMNLLLSLTFLHYANVMYLHWVALAEHVACVSTLAWNHTAEDAYCQHCFVWILGWSLASCPPWLLHQHRNLCWLPLAISFCSGIIGYPLILCSQHK